MLGGLPVRIKIRTVLPGTDPSSEVLPSERESGRSDEDRAGADHRGRVVEDCARNTTLPVCRCARMRAFVSACVAVRGGACQRVSERVSQCVRAWVSVRAAVGDTDNGTDV